MTIKVRSITRDVAALSMRAELGSVDAENRTVDMTFSTGARVYRPGWFDAGSFEELSMDPAHVRMDRLSSGNAPFLADHSGSTSNVLGVISAARVENGVGTAKVRFPTAGTDARADQIFEKIRQKIIRNVSVGYRIHRMEKVGTEARGNDDVPIYRATDWEPHEVSAVAIPADASATFRSEEQSNPCVFVTREEKSVEKTEEEKRAEAAKAELEKREAAAKATMKSEIEAASARAVKLERERTAGIRHAVRAAKLDDKFAETLIADEKLDLDGARAAVLDALADKSDETTEQRSPEISMGDTDHDKFVRHASAALFARVQHDPVGEAVRAKKVGFEKLELDPGDYRGMTLLSLARETLERGGISTRRMNNDQIVARAFTHRTAGFAGISDFPVLLENVMGKILMGAYAVTPDTWSRFCGTDTVPDFRDSPRYRQGSFGALDALGENSEFKNKSIPDGQKTVLNVATKGNIIAITRQLIINDDMSAFSNLASMLGRAAKLSIELDVYALLSANSNLGTNVTVGGVTHALFDAAWGNVGTGSALGVAGLDADRVTMGSQKDISANEYIDVRPRVLLVPLGLGGQARILNTSLYDPDASNKLQLPNKVAGLFSDVVDTPRLTGTRRYQFADPAVAAAIKVVFLEGQSQGPVMETDQGWRVDGTEMKVRMDYKVQPFDPKGALTNAGA